MNPDWIEHRRGRDGERVGWIAPEGDGFVAVDLLGRRVTEAVEWFEAEEALDERGIGYLADSYELDLGDGRSVRVRIAEISSGGIRVSEDHGPAIEAPRVDYTLPFPMPAELRVL